MRQAEGAHCRLISRGECTKTLRTPSAQLSRSLQLPLLMWAEYGQSIGSTALGYAGAAILSETYVLITRSPTRAPLALEK